MSDKPLSYCAAEVRRHDPDRFLTALFAPADRREDLFALYAFNLEIAKTREVVSETLLGQIRLQWWREAIEGVYTGAPRAHQVVAPLARAIDRAGLARSRFDRLIDARETDLDDKPPATLADLLAYAEASSASLIELALEILGVRGEAATTAAHGVGIAWALIGLLRAVPFHARQRRLYLPQDLMSQAGVDAAQLLERGRADGLTAVTRQIADRAEACLDEARRLRRRLPGAGIAALLPATLATGYLRELRRAGYDPFALDLRQKRPFKPLRLTLAALRGRY
ncbi:MAG TPA: phytoene/squalene synthase family protein [Alphaproteobacteria bacterium]|nr:phytoene/squalene synthase family protein [Alphaproteobacteria bacterium]